MSVFTGWRAALRIARRDATRAKGRSALVVAMIAVPVLGVTALDVTYRSMTPTVAEQLTNIMGSADALFSDETMGPIEQLPDGAVSHTYMGVDDAPPVENGDPLDIRTTFPKGSRAISIQSVPASVTTRYGITNTDIVEIRTSDTMARGKIDLVRGAYPHGKGEMAATEPFMKATGLHVGSTTTVRNSGRTYTVTGVVELPGELKTEALYADPGAVIAPWKAEADHDKKVLPPNAGSMDWLVKGPAGVGVTWPHVMAANKSGVLVTSRQVALDPPPDSEIPLMARNPQTGDRGSEELSTPLVTVIAMAVLEIVLLAGPAFAVGARRSRRQLGLLGTCGGDRRHVRAVVLGGGLVLGGIGAVTGVVVGLGLTAAFQPVIESWAGHRFGSLTMPPLELLGIAAIGLITGLLAAFAPAIVASRQSVLESLTGRRGVRRSSRVLPVLGTCVLALGGAIALFGGTIGGSALVAGGSIVAELGLLACIPVIVGFLGRLGRRLPLSPRMALRDAARNRGRTAPAVAAVMAAVAGSVGIATYMSSYSAEYEYNYVPLLTKGTIVLSSFDEESAERLPLARTAVERNTAVTGGHADFRRVWAGSDCRLYEDNHCGTLKLVKPDGNAHSCPLTRKGAKELAARLSADEHKKLTRSPACLTDLMASSFFSTDESNIVVADAALLDTYVKLDDPAAAEALAAGTPVLLNPVYAKNGEVTIKSVHQYSEKDKKNWKQHPGKARTAVDQLKVYVAPARYAATPGIRMILPERTAERLGLHTRAAGSVYAVAHAPTNAEDQRVSGAIAQAGGGMWMRSDYGPGRQDNTVLLILTLFAGVVTLGAAAITTGLAKADAEADLNTLSAVGAPPGVRRRLSGFQCVVVALTGVVLGTLAGLVPAVALRLVDLREALAQMRMDPTQSAYTPIVLPWTAIGLLVVCVPLLAGLLAAALTRSRLALARRAG
ncbi:MULTISPECIES: ABC transporter permease [unclassified Streptomyces]|uniref:ABC transporter permease n=1 Tax=unclassified Streptomyces TaxID=2593676 RepID=UPI00225052C4|nr:MULTISPECIES: ABC transporter permease [unclassified Streptomyces]WSP56187.1 ABC transporter permease [Streptomyces sp. NBC_01241]WSU23116.1 ABC transporter permease [Streptomyces sp. NBC_01108]MCX4796345.1 ABC transporter permease [Streptomyces sp. NBC_01242]WSJ37584.1 ABC transporter permease [Streptomyces sp. NBC_01321]WSP63982.1 ABC transporter permease [Streptomyces sp. NBC_01240]